ncbi:MAG: cytochrome c-type biogenesis CcmF C-terminal domain-containing protein, partial [Halodesulfurarchaeum sp.]
FAVSETVSVGPGERVAVPGGYSIEVVGFHNETHATHVERGPVLAVYDGPGPAVYRATPAVDRYPSRNQTLRDPDIWSTTSRDVYFIFNGVRQGKAFIEVKFMPLVSFLWYGGGIVIVGGLLALWPEFGEGGQGPPGGGGEINSETVTDETEGNEREENDGD